MDDEITKFRLETQYNNIVNVNKMYLETRTTLWYEKNTLSKKT